MFRSAPSGILRVHHTLTAFIDTGVVANITLSAVSEIKDYRYPTIGEVVLSIASLSRNSIMNGNDSMLWHHCYAFTYAFTSQRRLHCRHLNFQGNLQVYSNYMQRFLWVYAFLFIKFTFPWDSATSFSKTLQCAHSNNKISAAIGHISLLASFAYIYLSLEALSPIFASIVLIWHARYGSKALETCNHWAVNNPFWTCM